MKSEQELKDLVRIKYGEIASQEKSYNEASCCGAGPCSTEVYNIMSESYTSLDGYEADADLGLGCGLPTKFAKIKRGDTVIDLGSGAGNDCFVARRETGTEGRVIGIDFTEAMIEKARSNADKLGYDNVEFLHGDIEEIPLPDAVADVIVSNCVLNLVPNKDKVMKEIFRMLKAGGHFSISDIVVIGKLPEEIKNAAEMYAGCVAGAIQKDDYLSMIVDNGFENITIQKEKQIEIPRDILERYIDASSMQSMHMEAGIFSITVYAEKPSGCECAVPCCN